MAGVCVGRAWRSRGVYRCGCSGLAAALGDEMNIVAQVLGVILLLWVTGVVIAVLLAEWLCRVIEKALKD